MKKNHNSQENRTVRLFAAAAFLNDLGSDIIYPIWPLFVTTVLKANMAALGFLDGLGEALVSLSQAGSGYISDKLRKRKLFIWTGYLLGSLSRLGYSLSAAWPQLIPFRIMDRAGKIRSAPRDAVVADISGDESRGKNFGLLRSMDNLGAVAGVLLCIVLIDLLGYRVLFALAAIPSLAAALLIFFSFREKKPDRTKLFKGISFKDLDKNFRLFLTLSALFSLGTFSYSFLLLYASEFGFEPTLIPVLYLLYTASASVFSLPFGRLSDKIGRKPVLILSFLLWGIVCLCFITCRIRPVVALTFILFGAHKGALDPVQKTLVSELAPCELRASCLGGFQMVLGLCALPASVIAGILWEKAGLYSPLYFSLVMTAAATILLFFVKKR